MKLGRKIRSIYVAARRPDAFMAFEHESASTLRGEINKKKAERFVTLKLLYRSASSPFII